MIRRHPRTKRTDTPLPYPPLFRSLLRHRPLRRGQRQGGERRQSHHQLAKKPHCFLPHIRRARDTLRRAARPLTKGPTAYWPDRDIMILIGKLSRSEEHTSELQSLMRISYAVFCMQKQKNTKI